MQPMNEWQQRIDDLRKVRFTITAIAKEIGVSRQTVHNLVNGSTADPGHRIGDSIIKLHNRECAGVASGANQIHQA